MRGSVERAAVSPSAADRSQPIAAEQAFAWRGGGAGPAPTLGREITVADTTLIADCAGALYWADRRLLVVSDLHLEKGSSYA